METCKERLKSLGIKGYNQFVYPGGGESYVTAHKYFKSARLIRGNAICPPSIDPYRLRTIYMQRHTNITDQLVSLEIVKKYGVALITFHDIIPDGAEITQKEDVSFSTFKTIVDKVIELGIPVMTMGNLWETFRWNNRM